MDYIRGNIIKYVTRSPYKNDSPLQDLEKARWYLEYLIAEIKEKMNAKQK
jgi:hypothetical protein